MHKAFILHDHILPNPTQYQNKQQIISFLRQKAVVNGLLIMRIGP